MSVISGRRFRLVLAGTLAIPLFGANGVVNNVLLQWRDQADRCEETSQADDGAVMGVAMFEAVNAIAGKYTPYVARINAPKGSSTDAAAAQAAHDVLVKVCPDMQSAFDGALKTSLSLVKDSVARESGVAVGKQAAPRSTVIAEEFGKEFPSIVLDMDKSLLRRYHSAQEYVDDVTESRIYAGVHYRFSANAGRDAGVKVGKLSVERYFKRK